MMSIQNFYRLCIWLPILVPAVLMVVAKVLTLPIASGPLILEMLVYSLLYGGIPYAVLAAAATWWVGNQDENQIRHVMFRAPLLMMAVFVPTALAAGFAVGAAAPFAAVAVLGSIVILFIGYGYVALTVLLRAVLAGLLQQRAGAQVE